MLSSRRREVALTRGWRDAALPDVEMDDQKEPAARGRFAERGDITTPL
jgi:hypothetical protein